MKLESAILGLIAITGNWASGQVAASSVQTPAPRKLFIQPTSTEVAGGKASLTISMLRRQAATYIGSYDLKVSPWYFKNETGKLIMSVPDESVQKLIQGIAVDFTGSVTTDGEAKARTVNARATPSGKEQGSVTFSFIGEARKVIFNTKYQFRNE
ncbi:hypothetical protein ACXR0O_12275 [Verrucomicrobiota bacterium sgz303538]